MTIRFLRYARVFVFLLAASVLSAQDAPTVLRAFVGYNTVKASTRLTPELRTEVEALAKQAQVAGLAGRYGEALKHLAHGTALMRGEPWTPGAVLAGGLQFSVDHALPEPGQAVEARLRPVFSPDSLPEGDVQVSLRMMPTVGGNAIALATVPDVKAAALLQPWTRAVTIPETVADGTYRLEVEVTGLDAPVRKATAVTVQKGLAARVAALQQRLKAVPANAPAAGVASVEYALSLRERVDRGEIEPLRPDSRVDFARELREAEAALTALEAGKSPFAGRKGDFRRAYRSTVDSTLQPYRLFVPAAYDGVKALPLVVALHGMGGNENSFFDLYANGALKTEAEKRGYLVVTPKGRGAASMYQGDAEKDVMDVLAEVRRDYLVDPSRIFLTGHSMGGYGTWSIAMNHPEVFAALAPVAGGGNPARMDAIRHIPQLVVHGDADRTVAVTQSRNMVEAAKKAGAEVKYIEVPGGNHTEIVVPNFPAIFDWFDTHPKSLLAKPAVSGQ